MLPRLQALQQIVSHAGPQACLVSPLGFVTRDLFSLTAELRERCFYCMGSMGSIVPLALGISRSQPDVHVCAIEGDGSLLMNLGALVTLRRYAQGPISLFVFDNGCYESTGGQPTQPDNFKLEDVCRATGLTTSVATNEQSIDDFFHTRETFPQRVAVLVVKVSVAPPCARVNEEPRVIAKRFSSWLRSRKENPA
jgi:phosphonopyruvate decarboxylase